MSAEYNLETFSDAWYMDSGATEYMSNCCDKFSSYKKFDTVENIKMENIFKQLDQEISTFLLSMEKNRCESISVIFFTYQKFQSFFGGYNS